jgi:thiopurine S-methyltransferase
MHEVTMQTEFWEERWRAGQIGFHLPRVHRFLPRFYPVLQVPEGGRMLIPLCGKSLDMRWLVEQGAEVLGVELSALAVAAFFAEQRLTAQRGRVGALESWQAGPITLLQGDLFALTREDVGPLAAIYDRAALVALPSEMRPRYAAKLAELLPVGGRLLLTSYVYRQAEMAGPPFEVPLSKIKLLFGGAFSIEVLHAEDALELHPGLKDRGLSVLREFCCLLQRA